MDSQDASNNNIFSSSSLATSNRMNDGLPLLSISVHKRGSHFGEQPNDVNNHPQASSFLQQDQHQHYPQQHSHQSAYYYYENRPISEDSVTLESVSVVRSWREVAFPIAVLTFTLIGILAVGLVLLLWLKKNLNGQDQSKKKISKKDIVSPIDIQPVYKNTKMSENECSQVEHITTNVQNSPPSSAVPETPCSTTVDELASSEEIVSDPYLTEPQLVPPVNTLYKNITADNLTMVSSPHNLRRAHAKSSLNNLSLISTSPSSISSPSPPVRSAGRKFSFNQSSFYEQQQQLSSSRNKFCANSGRENDNLLYFGKLGSKDECLISKIAVLRGDVCCVQPPQQHVSAVFDDSETVSSTYTPISSSPKIIYTSDAPAANRAEHFFSPLSDDKENVMKCGPAFDNSNSRNFKAFRGNHSFVHSMDTSDSPTPSNKKVLTQSPIFFTNDQNSPNIYDSSSSPTLIPSLTPSSISSSATSTATNTTPNAIMNNCSSASSTNGRFTFSPKVINEYGYHESPQSALNPVSGDGKFGNSYFRFPAVDTFTPPNTAQVSSHQASNKPTVLKIPSLVTSWIPSLETPTKELSPPPHQPKPSTNVRCKQSTECITIDQLTVSEVDDSNTPAKNNRSDGAYVNDASSNRASRRARLKSISLDSEGARLVEENLTTSIPVEELVEIAANQTHHSVSETQLQLQSLNQSQTLSGIDENNYTSCKKQRNIFNLTLNLNDKDESLMLDDDYKFNEFYFEYYDYDDEEDEEYEMDCNNGTGYSEKRKKQHSQLQTPKTPTLTQTRKKASSLDSDQSLNYLLPQPVRTHSAMDKGEHRTSSRCTLANPSTSSIRTSSLSVPTTPKRQPYRLQHQQQQQHGKFKSNRCINDSVSSINNSPASERHLLCGFQQKLGSFEENADNYQSPTDGDSKAIVIKNAFSNIPQQKDQNLSVSNVNLKTLPEITPVCNFAEKSNEPTTTEKPPIQTLNKSRSSILQRRGSNHSLTLNLDAASGGGGLSKGLSASNYSLGNYKGSHLSLAGSSYNLQQQQSQHQSAHQSAVQIVQTKKNLLQRRGSNTSLVLNLQGSSTSLNRYNSHSSLNIQNQPTLRPIKKGLLERRNSNTSLTLINIQNRALSVSNCNLPGSICSLNSMATYQTQNEALMLEEDEHQLAVNNNQSSCCNRASSGVANESHLSPNCQQHGGRRKFLSSDSLHNIISSRAGCCCQQKETSMENPEMCYHRGQMNNYGGSIDDMKQQQASQSNDCPCTMNKNIKGSDKLSISSNDMFKFKSTVTSTASTNNLTQFTCCDCCCCNCADALAGGVNTMSISNTNVRKITTKPLSPQTTSEDFKIYLANIQFLQNASNMLSATYMKNLHFIFKKSYGSYDKSRDGNDGANNDVKLTNLSIVATAPDGESASAEQNNSTDFSDDCSALLSDEEQKKMILKIHQEFWDLPTNYQEKPLVFGSQSKNRYKTILPNEHSRVILKAEPGMLTEPYINANFIKGPDYTNNSYIATQGPMANTIYEFWLMVQQNVMKVASHSSGNLMHVEQKLIMLTDFIENNRQKCAVYFPQKLNESIVFSSLANANTKTVLANSENIIAEAQNCTDTYLSRPAKASINFNYFLISNIGMCRKNGYTMRKLLVIYSYLEKNEKLEKRSAYTIYHYWFPDWPDHRSPEDIDVLLDMSLDILDNDCSKDFDDMLDAVSEGRVCSLPIIHCSAGIGRTGCLLAILNGLSQIRSSFNASKAVSKLDTDDSGEESGLLAAPSGLQQHPPFWNISGQICVDILGIVCNLRLQRGGMVQNSEQYELIHRAICLYMQKLSL